MQSKDKETMTVIAILLAFAGLGVLSCESTAPSATVQASSGSGSGSGGGSTPNPGGTSSTPTATCSPASGYTCSEFFLYVAANPSATPTAPTEQATLSELGTLGGGLTGNWSSPCAIASGTSTPTTMYCTYDIEEDDIYLAGSTWKLGGTSSNGTSTIAPATQDDRLFITYNFPYALGCAYFTLTPVWFYNYKPSIGPTSVTETLVAASPTPTVSWASSGGSGSTFSNGACSTTGTTQNCCTGSYTFSYVDQTNGNNNTTSTKNWAAAGAYAGCLSGPGTNKDSWPAATVSSLASSYYGEPNTTVANVSLAGSTFTGNIPIYGGGAYGYLSNAYPTSYFDVSAITKYLPTNSSSWPNAFAGVNSVPTANPFWQATCYNHADEILYQINLMIRPWSSHAQYAAAVTANGTGTLQWQYGGYQYYNDPFLDFPAWSDNYSADNTSGAASAYGAAGSQWGSAYDWAQLPPPGGSGSNTGTVTYPGANL